MTSYPSSDCGNAFNALMQEVCVGHGYCGGLIDGAPAHVTDFIPKIGPVTADQFVEWVIIAEGPDTGEVPESHRAAIREMFVRNMGGEEVDATKLEWSIVAGND